MAVYWSCGFFAEGFWAAQIKYRIHNQYDVARERSEHRHLRQSDFRTRPFVTCN